MDDFYSVEHWHRRLCPVTEQLTISGDLHNDPDRAAAQIALWRETGITHVLDTRHEWTDEELVANEAPEIVYGRIGTHDAGYGQPDEWFDEGVTFALTAMAEPGSRVLVHCHMGINRGPTMAFRILLELGWDPIDALRAIRTARPIADIGYAGDALDHYHRSSATPDDERRTNMDRVAAWRRGYTETGLHLTRDDAGEPTG